MPEEVENRKEINNGKTMERGKHLEMVDAPSSDKELSYSG